MAKVAIKQPEKAVEELINSSAPEYSEEQIKALQARLGIETTGNFDEVTKRRVRYFQRVKNLEVTGEADDILWKALKI